MDDKATVTLASSDTSAEGRPGAGPSNSPGQLVAAARSAVQANLPVLAAELLVWQQCGSLDDGKLREIAETLKPVSDHDSLGMTQNLVTNAALTAAARSGLNPTETDIGTWATDVFRCFPHGIRTVLFLDLAFERGFTRETAASHVRIGLDAGTYGIGNDMQLVRQA